MKKLFVSLVLLWAVTSYAQSFKPGYIITLKNDTIYGSIKYQNSNASALRCIFKKTEDTEERTYTPNGINGYRFENGKYYVSKNVEFNGQTQPLFLEYIVDGIVDLYMLYQSNRDNYFIEKENKLYYLPEGEKTIIKEGKEYNYEDNRYKGILKTLFNESANASKKAETITLNRESLINISTQYHNAVCEGEKCIVYKKEKTPRTKKLGIQYGYNALKIFTNTSFRFPDAYLSNFETSYETFNTVGFFFQINFPKLNENVFLQYSFMQGKVSHMGTASTAHPYQHGTYNFNLKQQLTFHSLTVQYVAPGNYIRPYIKLGGSTAYADLKNVKINDEPFEKHPFTSGFNALNASIGCNIKLIKQVELNLDAQYQYGTGYFTDFKISNIALQSGIAFIF
jgi:hypothetical protein